MSKISKELEHMMKVGLKASKTLENYRKVLFAQREETLKILRAFKDETQKEKNAC